jgi:hypothetical protein
LKRQLTHSIAASLLLLSALTLPACDKGSLLKQAEEVTLTAGDVVSALKTTLPPDDPRLEKVSLWLARAGAFRAAVERASGENPDTLALFADVVRGFQEAVLPFVDLSPNIRLAIAAADVALRVVARRLQKEAVKVAKTRPEVARSPQVAGAASTVAAYLATPEVKKVAP